MASIRANITCLLSRMSLLVEGVNRAMDRHHYQEMQEKMKSEMHAQWLGRIRHHGVANLGALFLTLKVPCP